MITTAAVLLGSCLGNGQGVSAKVLNTIPKAMRGVWHDKYGGTTTFGAHSMTEVDHYDHKTSVTHWHFATSNPSIRKWVNHKPQFNKVTRNERINRYSNGRIVIWWQENSAETGTMHPTYYRLSHKMINGHRYQKLIESTGAGFGINPFNHYRVRHLPKTHGFHYYQHRNLVKVTEDTRAYRIRITYPLATAKPDASVLLKKGTILKVIYPGTTWDWVIVGSRRFPETSKHVWVTNRSKANWFEVLHHYKSMKESVKYLV